MKRPIFCAAAALLLTAACSTGHSGGRQVATVASSSTTASSSSAPGSAPASALAFSGCMRSSGVAHFPDPDRGGALPKVSPQQLGVSSSMLQAAQQTCAYLLRSSSSWTQQTIDAMRDFARCMRSHGMRNWPDPTTDSTGQPVFDLHGRIAPDSAQSATASGTCSHLLHPAPGQNGTTLCDGIGEPGCHHYG